MNVLVSGATGFLAGHLIPHLSRAGHTVTAAGHDPNRIPAGHGVRPVYWDCSQNEVPSGLFDRLDAVIHLVQANVPFPDRAAEMFAVNVASTQLLLERASTSGVRRFVYTSSGSVYGSGQQPWSESDPPQATDYYAATKVASERLISAYADLLPHTIFRLFAPYGPGQRNRMVPGLIKRVTSGAPVTVAGGSGPAYNPLYVSHVVDVLTQSLDATGNQLLNVGGNQVLTIRDMAETIGRVIGREPVIQDQAGTPARFVGDLAQLRRNYSLPDRLTSFEDGVRSMLEA